MVSVVRLWARNSLKILKSDSKGQDISAISLVAFTCKLIQFVLCFT